MTRFCLNLVTFIALVSTFGIVSSATEKLPLARVKAWDLASIPVATPVSRGDMQSVLYRFVDEVGGKKVLCYFTDTIFASPAGSGPSCFPLTNLN